MASFPEQTRVYENARAACFSVFDAASQELAACLTALIQEVRALEQHPLMEPPGARASLQSVLGGIHVSEEILKLADLPEENALLPEPEPHRFSALLANWPGPEKDLLDLARIPPVAIETANRSLATQLAAILDAALFYVWIDSDPLRMILENNLVRSGAELRDRLASRLNEFVTLPSSRLSDRFRAATLDFIATYETVLVAYDVMAKLKKPVEAEPDEKQEDGNLALQRTLGEIRNAETSLAWRGLRSTLTDYLHFSGEEFRRLIELTGNPWAFQDREASPWFKPIYQILGFNPAAWPIQQLNEQEVAELRRLLEISPQWLDGAGITDASPVKARATARAVLAERLFPAEPHFDPQVLRSVSLAQNVGLSDEDFELLERAVQRGSGDLARCGWLAAAALHLARQRQDWNWKENFAVPQDSRLDTIFKCAHGLYGKLAKLDYHPRAANLRMALLWDLLYDPRMPATSPFELDAKSPEVARFLDFPVATYVQLLDDARGNLPALLSERIRFYGASDLDAIGSQYPISSPELTLASALLRWSRRHELRLLPASGSRRSPFPELAAFIADLEDIRTAADWKAVESRVHQGVALRGDLFGPHSRVRDLENLVVESLPPPRHYTAGIDLSLDRLISLPIPRLRALLRLLRLGPRILEILARDFKEETPEGIRKGFKALELLIADDKPDAEAPLPILQVRALTRLFETTRVTQVSCENHWIFLDEWRRIHWFRKVTGLETVCCAVAQRISKGPLYRRLDEFRLPEDLRFDQHKKWGNPTDVEAHPETAAAHQAWLAAAQSPAWQANLDGFSKRIFSPEMDPWRGAYDEERPFRVVPDGEASFVLIAWCLLEACQRSKKNRSSLEAWLGGDGALPCLPPTRWGNSKWRSVRPEEFLREFGLQTADGAPTERLHHFLDWILLETECLAKGGYSWKESDIWVGAPEFLLTQINRSYWPARIAWHRETADGGKRTVSTAGLAALRAVWKVISDVLDAPGNDADSVLASLKSHGRLVDFHEEFLYRRFREMPVILVAVPLTPPVDPTTNAPGAFAILRMSGVFLTREYVRRARLGEYGDWLRFGRVASTYRLAAERLFALQRILRTLTPALVAAAGLEGCQGEPGTRPRRVGTSVRRSPRSSRDSAPEEGSKNRAGVVGDRGAS